MKKVVLLFSLLLTLFAMSALAQTSTTAVVPATFRGIDNQQYVLADGNRLWVDIQTYPFSHFLQYGLYPNYLTCNDIVSHSFAQVGKTPTSFNRDPGTTFIYTASCEFTDVNGVVSTWGVNLSGTMIYKPSGGGRSGGSAGVYFVLDDKGTFKITLQ